MEMTSRAIQPLPGLQPPRPARQSLDLIGRCNLFVVWNCDCRGELDDRNRRGAASVPGPPHTKAALDAAPLAARR